MPIQWTQELLAGQGEADPVLVRASQRWRIRVVSDRAGALASPDASGGVGVPRSEDFLAILDEEFRLWVRCPAVGDPYAARAGGGGVSLEVVADVTAGVEHRVSVRRRPSDDLQARWSCTCGAGSRGTGTPELVAMAADEHASAARARDGARRPTDDVVAQGTDGQWSKRSIAVVRRYRACVRSDRSAVKAHQRGRGEEFELVVDGRLGLWVRLFGSEAALRADQDARGVSLILLEVA
jgi:hypothetical protein